MILDDIQHCAAGLPLSLQVELLHYAMFLEQKAQEDLPVLSEDVRRQRLAAALEQAAALNPFADIDDPVAWQREQREDRPLFGRNDDD